MLRIVRLRRAGTNPDPGVVEREVVGMRMTEGPPRATVSRPVSLTSSLRSTLRRRDLARRYVAPAEALISSGRGDEAEALLQEGVERYPGSIDLLVASADIAFRSNHLSLAAQRWEAAVAAAPDRWASHVHLSATLRRLRETARAAEVIAEAERRFPGRPGVLAEAACVAEAKTDFAGSLAYWRRVTRARRPPPLWLSAEAEILILLDRLDEADAVLDRASRSLPRVPAETDLRSVMAARGRVISARKDWAAAITYWKDFQRRFPRSEQGWHQLGLAIENQAFMNAEAQSAAEPVGIEAAASIDVVENKAAHELLMGFESIGSGCEFGLVQRRFGAEPLSLLRWTAAPMSTVIAALEHDLDGMGSPEHTELVTLANGQYYVRDQRWNLAMHTWISVGQVERAALLDRMCRRVAFLKDKLLADAASAEKIFVHFCDAIDAKAFAHLHALLRRHGPVQLLGVLPVSGAVAPGDVIQVGEDRFLGFIPRFGNRGSWDILFDDWLAICRATRDLAEAARADRREPPGLDAVPPVTGP